MTDVLDQVLADLTAETEQLDERVAALDPAGWATVTTPEGWTVGHQVGHLAWTDAASLLAITDPEAFARATEAGAQDPGGFVDAGAEEWAALGPDELLRRWRAGRGALVEALRGVPAGRRIPWYGPPMAAASMATARMMETWAHGHDVAEGLGSSSPQTDRCRHVCHLGVRTFGFAHVVRGEDVPDVEVHVALTAPGGDLWTWGSPDAPERVTGSAHDFALLATRRRHVDDVDVHAEGEHARHWLTIVQAFAGMPGSDPVPLAEREGAR